MRRVCYQAIAGLVFVVFLSAVEAADVIYGFNGVFVGQDLKTVVEFDQDDFKRFQKTDDLKLRVMEGDKVIREDAVSYDGRQWVWNKVLPFSEDLKLLILKDGEPVSMPYLADTRSSLRFSKDDSGLPFLKGLHPLDKHPVVESSEVKILPIEAKKFKGCKEKVLVLVFDEKSNTLLWQGYDVLKNLSATDEISLAEGMQPTVAIVTDEGSCTK